MRMSGSFWLGLLLPLACTTHPESCDTGAPAGEVAAQSAPSLESPLAREETTTTGEAVSLFDGATLGRWRVLGEDAFPGHGAIHVADEAIAADSGDPYTGIMLTGPFPTEEYEISLKARRLSGHDIFCGLTAPVGAEHVTLVLGGWGNNLVGLSCIDGLNASENETTVQKSFLDGVWYDVSLRVTKRAVEAWIDDECVIEYERGDHRFTLYDQLLCMRPVGLFTWYSKAEWKELRYSLLRPDE